MSRKMIPERTPMPEQPPEKRRRNFQEVALGYTPEMAQREASRCLQCKKPGCVEGCPVHVPIPEFISHVKEGFFIEACRKIKEVNLMPGVCGRVCPQERQCEAGCLLGKKHEPVAIGRLERFVADWDMKEGGNGMVSAEPSTGKRIAIVGSGPSGLSCAYDLARMGHEVTIFEALHEPGGVLVYGIPEFRLPKAIVAQEIKGLKELGVEIITNAVVGKLIDFEEIMAEFDACFIGTGAGVPRFMGIDGEELNGVYSANEFLTRVNLMRAYDFPEYDTPVKRGSRVAVVGGGNVAMDAVRTALRLGAKEAIIIYRRSMTELPARHEEVGHAVEEGVRFELCSCPVRIMGEDGWVKEIECVRMDLCGIDESGRRRPVPVEGSEFTIAADIVIVAIGTEANPLLLEHIQGLELNKRGYISVDEETGMTNIEGLFAGGDIVTGSATVISAMGAGRKAARAIDGYLKNRVGKRRRGGVRR